MDDLVTNIVLWIVIGSILVALQYLGRSRGGACHRPPERKDEAKDGRDDEAPTIRRPHRG